MVKQRKRWILLVLAMLIAAFVWLLHGRSDRGPIYKGRHVADWVADALMESPPSKVSDLVIQIGAPAVPFIVKQGLHDPSHKNHWLAYDTVDAFYTKHPLLGGVALDPHVLKLHNCAEAHHSASGLLWRQGTNAMAAVPDVIDCMELCPNSHYINTQCLLDTLNEIGRDDATALAYLTKLARETNSFSLSAATYVYWRTADTNLMVQTIAALGLQAVNARELFWLREDHALNQHVVPMLERMYDDPKCDSEDRSAIMDDLTSRSNDASAAIARLLAQYPEAQAQ